MAGPSREDSLINGQRGDQAKKDGLWKDNDEQYYGVNGDGDRRSTRSAESGSGRWHYPANFEDTLPSLDVDNGKKKKKKKKDRWARTEDAYSLQGDDLPGAGERRKRKKKKDKSVKNHSTVGGANDDSFDQRSDSYSAMDVPEDPEGGAYSDLRRERERERERERVGNGHGNGNGSVPSSFGRDGGDGLDHQF